jgi:moderate conductance mechanosensitive channel
MWEKPVKNPAARLRLNAAIVCMVAGLVCISPAITTESVSAQEAVSIKPAAGVVDPAAGEDLEALAARIESDRGREQLLSEIRALIALQKQNTQPSPEKPISERLADTASRTFEETTQSLREVGRFFPNRQALSNWIQNQISDPAKVSRMAQQAWPVVLIFGIAWLAELFAARLLARPRRRLEERAHEARVVRLTLTVGRSLLRLGALAAFIVAGLTVFFFLQPGATLGKVVLQAFAAYTAGRVLMIAARMMLAPAVPSLRWVPIDSEAARTLFVWIRRLVTVALAGYLLASILLLFGLPPRGFAALMNLLGMILLAMLIVFVLRHRSAVAGWIRGPEDASSAQHTFSRSFRRGLAAVWHLLAIAYLTGFFAVWWQSIKGGMIYLVRGSLLSALVLFLVWLAFQVLQLGVDRALAGGKEPGELPAGLKARIGVYLPVVLNVVRTATLLFAGLSILEAWKVDAYQWLKAPAGQRLFSVFFSIALVLAIAVAVWEVVNVATERYLAEAERSGKTPAQSARARTLLPLMRKALLLVLSVIVSLMVLSELGIHIGPLLAGAGIIGLAVGFGAQKLVQDIITGVFILLEDAVAVGDVVKVAGIGGQVEDLSIRSIRLRDLSGNVHTIPFSSVDTVTNMTRLYSYYLIDIGVAYREDTDQVADVCRGIVDEMRSDPEFGPDIIEPLEVLGVDQFADSAVIIKARIKTRPIKQWAVGREFNRRMKKRFDELGIEIPFPHRTLYFGTPKDGSVPPPQVALEQT